MTLQRRTPILRSVAVVAALGGLSAACSSERDPLEIGLRRIALDLAFRDAAKAEPVAPREVITQVIPEELTVGFDDLLDEVESTPTAARQRTVVRVPPPPPTRAAPCAVADPSATPERQAFVVIKDPPKVGTYLRRNEGELDIRFATFGFKVPYPASTAWDLPRVDANNGPTVVSDGDQKAIGGVPDAVKNNTTAAPPNYEFDIVRKSLPGYSTTDTYFYTYTGATGGDYLYLKKRVTVADGAVSEFNPTPPIRVVRLGISPGGEGTTSSESSHAGLDRTTNVAMTIQSDVIGREDVDVCGEVLDTYIVRFQERVVDLSKSPPDSSGNDPETYNFWNIQFDNGLLIVRETVNSVTRTSVKVPGTPAPVPVEIRANYSSTLRSPEPAPLGTPAPRVADPAASDEPSSPSPDEEEDE